MKINNDIRNHVLQDLKNHLPQTIGVKRFSNGQPDTLDANGDDLPCVAVSLGEGKRADDGFDSLDWSAPLIISIYAIGDERGIDPVLDEISQAVLDVLGNDYTANGLISLFNRSGFDYTRDEVAPWGIYHLVFDIEYEEASL